MHNDKKVASAVLRNINNKVGFWWFAYGEGGDEVELLMLLMMRIVC